MPILEDEKKRGIEFVIPEYPVDVKPGIEGKIAPQPHKLRGTMPDMQDREIEVVAPRPQPQG